MQFVWNLKVIFLPNSARIVSALQLGAMFEFHATFRALVMHHLLEQSAAMHSAVPIKNANALKKTYVKQ